MSDGALHAKIAFGGVLVASAGAAFIMHREPALAGGIVTGAVNGWLVTPDVDIPHKTFEEDRWYILWRPLGIAWQWFWAGYAYIFPHRGVSHFLILGTLTRAVYQTAVLAVLSCALIGAVLIGAVLISGVSVQVRAGATIDEISENEEIVIWLGAWLGAWSLQDGLHILTDALSGRRNRRRRRLLVAIVIALAALFIYSRR